MMITAATIAFIHVVMYAVIIWLGWRSYRVLRKRSGLYIGIGFLFFFGYRLWRLISLLALGYMPEDQGGFDTAALFVGTGFLVGGFWMLQEENEALLQKLKIQPVPSAGDLSPEYWPPVFEKAAERAVRANIRPELLNPQENSDSD